MSGQSQKTLKVLAKQALRADIGRVPRQSAAIAVAVALTALVILAAGVNATGSALAGVAIGVLLAIAIATVSIDRPIRALVGGSLLLFAVTAAGVVPVVIATRTTPIAGGFAIAGLFVGFGLARFRLAAFGGGAVGTALAWLARVTLVVLLTAVGGALFTADLAQVVVAASVVVPIAELVDPEPGGGAMLGFVILCWLAYGGVWIATVAIPVSSVLSGSQQKRAEAALSRVLSAGRLGLGVGGIVIAMVYAFVVAGDLLPAAAPVLAAIVESTGVRVLLLRVFLAGIGVALAVLVLRQAGATVISVQPTWLPSALVVAVVAVVGAVLASDLLVSEVRAANPPGGWVISALVSFFAPVTVGLLFVVGGLVAIGVVLALGPLAASTGFLPERTAGARLVLGGLVLGAIIAAIGEGPAVRTFAGVVAGIIAWDIADHGATLTADMGTTPARRDSALIHAASTLVVGGIVLVGAAIVYLPLAGAAAIFQETALAIGLAVTAVLILITLLRG